jgi:methanogenic corrinoid protein MtbC1
MTAPSNTHFEPETSYGRYLGALLAGDRRVCREVFPEWLDSPLRLSDVYTDLVQRSLFEVEELRTRGRLSTATEHMATAIAEGLLNLAYPRLFAHPRTGKSAVVACVANEQHQIGGRMIADLFELNGWRSYFLETDTPVDAMQSIISQRTPNAVALSVTRPSSLETLVTTAVEIRTRFPRTPILVGAQATRSYFEEYAQSPGGVQHMRSLTEPEAWIRQGASGV